MKLTSTAATFLLFVLVSTSPAVGAGRSGRKTDRSWLLKPGIFGRLSSGGRRLALSWNGPGPVVRGGLKTGAATAIAPAIAGPPDVRQNVRVNDPAMDEVGHTNSESSIAVRSGRIVVGFNGAARNTSAWAVSEDGGASFLHQRLPGPPDGFTYGDPAVAFGPGGEVYYATMMSTGNDTISTVGVAKSTDGGMTFRAPVDAAAEVSDGVSLQDKEWLAVDTSPSSSYRGTVYVSWTFVGSFGQTIIYFTRSRDGGQTFDPPQPLSPLDTYGVWSPVIAVGPAGEVYVAFEDGHIYPDGITVVKSTDGGSSFTGPYGVVAVRGLSVLTGGGGVRASSYPTLAVDATGALHLAFAVTKSTATSDRADIMYTRSVNGGVNWSAPVTLNDDATATTQAFPWLAAAADGSVAVKWADRRNDAPNDGLTDVYMAISRDGGATWGKNFRVTDTNWVYGPVDMATVPRSYHGDYDGLAADGGNFYLSWSDERGSDPGVYFAWVPETFDGSTPDANVSARQVYGAVLQGHSAAFDLATSGTNGFSAPLSLSAGPALPGLNFAFSAPTVVPGGTVQLTASATTEVPPGDYHLTVTASGGGLSRATTIWLTVYPEARPVPVPSNVTATAGFTGSGGVVADGSGRLHLLYEDDTQAVRAEDVFYRRSLDGGVTWSAPLKLNSTGSFGIDTVLAADAAGHVVAVWVGGAITDTTTRIYAARSSDGGATFSAPAVLTPTDQHAVYPAVSLDKSGNPMVVYVEDGSTFTYVYTTRAVGGGVFDPPLAIPETAAATITRPGFAYDSKGVAYLAYTRQALDASGQVTSTVRLAVGKDGRNFASPVDLTHAADANAFAPHVAVGADDSVLIAYYAKLTSPSGDANREVMLIRSADGGTTFGAPVNVSNDAGQSYFPSVAVEGGGAIDVVWEDDPGGAGTGVLLCRSIDAGRTFSRPMNVSADLGLSGSAANPLETRGGSGRPAVSVAQNGTLFISWLDDSAANPDVFLVGTDPARLMNLPPTAPAPLKLSGNRVLVDVTWLNPYSGQGGAAFNLPQNDQFGYFYFTDPNDPEVFVKVLDFGSGSALCFVGGLTDFYYKVTFTMARTGQTLVFEKPAYQYIGYVNNIDLKFSSAPNGMAFVGALATGEPAAALPAARGVPALAVSPQSLDFSSGRVRVTIDWQNPYSGETGTAYGIPKGDAFGFFYYTDPTNPEVFVKVLDFGSGSALVFVGGLTDFSYKVTFTVLRTGQTLVFEKPPYQYIGFVDNSTLKF